MKKILITYFEPFNKEPLNATQYLIENYDFSFAKTICLPVVHKLAAEKLKKEINNNHYNLVICLGQANNRNCVSLERIAINLSDYRIKDNQNNQPIDIPIGNENAFFSSLPIRKIYDQLKNDYPISISNTAGTFVCNEVMYSLLESIKGTSTIGGFIHIPCCEKQENKQILHSKTVYQIILKIIKICKEDYEKNYN